MSRLDDVAMALREKLTLMGVSLQEETYIELARAAVEPLMEPSQFMMESTLSPNKELLFLEFTKPDERSGPFAFPRFMWRCMAKAILKEHEKATMRDV